MTLRELRTYHPHLFAEQTWYLGEAFMDWDAGNPVRLPTFTPCATPNGQELPRAAMLAKLFVTYPNARVWGQYLWCADTDRFGQRVYVGGVSEANGRKFEIHRHLAITERWGCATW